MSGLAGLVRRDFADESPLATGMPSYSRREEQIKLAEEIAQAFDNGTALLAEADIVRAEALRDAGLGRSLKARPAECRQSLHSGCRVNGVGATGLRSLLAVRPEGVNHQLRKVTPRQ